MRYEYLLLLVACLAVTLPLEFWLRARVYRRPRRLLWAVLPVAAVFYVWDAVAIGRGHWTYSPDHTTGILLPWAVPLEELVFFLVIPLCGLLTYEAVGTVLGRRPSRRSLSPDPPKPLVEPVETRSIDGAALTERSDPDPTPRSQGRKRSDRHGGPVDA